jgi:hypothetical protein
VATYWQQLQTYKEQTTNPSTRRNFFKCGTFTADSFSMCRVICSMLARLSEFYGAKADRSAILEKYFRSGHSPYKV